MHLQTGRTLSQVVFVLCGSLPRWGLSTF
jgi:hypothetical protein